MKKNFIFILVLCAISVFNYAEISTYYKQIPIQFDRISNDTIDNFVAKNGKKKLLNILDSNLIKLNNLIKISSENIKDDYIAFEYIGLNKKFNLAWDSFMQFKEFLPLSNVFYSNYSNKMGDTISVIKNINKLIIDKVDMNKLFLDNLYSKYGRIGFFTFCNHTNKYVSQSSLDTLYKAALIYPNDMRNEFYYALAEFDRNCGNAQNNAAFYKTQLYNKMKEDMSLEKALTDTNILSALNASKYILTPKYQFFAYSLYAKNFDIKANQKEIIYFLASQNKIDGGFKEYNLEKAEKTIKSKIEPTFYAFWALLELREQINALYPDDVKSQTTPVKNEPNNSSTKPTTKPTTKKK